MSLILLAVSAGAGLAWRGNLFGRGQDHLELAYELVKRGPLEISITERGSLESGNNVTLPSLVEGEAGTGILKIVDEGTIVTKDQVVVELDSSRFRNDKAAQQVIIEQAAASLKTAEKDAEIQNTQNESDIAAAELKLDLARLDLKKYKDGDYIQELNAIEGEIQLAQEELTRTSDKYAFTQRLIKKGYAKQSEVEADRVACEKARINVAVAEEKLEVLNQFTHARQIAELQANAGEFERELERVKLKADAALAKLEADLSAARLKYQVEKAKYEKILNQIEVCTMRAPRDGMVVYVNSSNSRSGRSRGASNEPMIYAGATVTERQPIIQLPDLSQMQVNARIHESKISMIHAGLTAKIHVEAMGSRVFHGTVTEVSLVPASANRRNYNVKEYSAFIDIDDDPSKVAASVLKPGLTAEVEILIERLPSVLQAPALSFVERGGHYFAWVLVGGNPVRREIKVGKSNEQMMEILDGLAERDKIVLKPRTYLPHEIARLEEEIPATADSPFAASRLPEPAPPRVFERAPRAGTDGQTGPAERPGESPGMNPASPGDNAQPDGGRRGRGGFRGGRDPLAWFQNLDKNSDGMLSEDELPERMKMMLTTADANHDKAIDKNEFRQAMEAFARERGGRESRPPRGSPADPGGGL